MNCRTHFFTLLLLSSALSASHAAFAGGAGFGNAGHRIATGAHAPQNSLSALSAALRGENGGAPMQEKSSYVYMEFDVRETADGEIVLQHDASLAHALPSGKFNAAAIAAIAQDPATQLRVGGKVGARISYGQLTPADLELKQIKTLRYRADSSESLPTLEEILDGSREWGLRKPLAAEIKLLRTDAGRRRYIDLLAQFRDNYARNAQLKFERGYDLDPAGVTIFALGGSFNNSFGKSGSASRTYWCGQMQRAGFARAYKPFSHGGSLCDVSLNEISGADAWNPLGDYGAALEDAAQ